MEATTPQVQHEWRIRALCIGFTWLLCFPAMLIGVMAVGGAARAVSTWRVPLDVVMAAITTGLWLFTGGIVAGYAGTQLRAAKRHDGHRRLRLLKLGTGAAIGLAIGLALLALGMKLGWLHRTRYLERAATLFTFIPAIIAFVGAATYRSQYHQLLNRPAQ